MSQPESPLCFFFWLSSLKGFFIVFVFFVFDCFGALSAQCQEFGRNFSWSFFAVTFIWLSFWALGNLKSFYRLCTSLHDLTRSFHAFSTLCRTPPPSPPLLKEMAPKTNIRIFFKKSWARWAKFQKWKSPKKLQSSVHKLKNVWTQFCDSFACKCKGGVGAAPATKNTKYRTCLISLAKYFYLDLDYSFCSITPNAEQRNGERHDICYRKQKIVSFSTAVVSGFETRPHWWNPTTPQNGNCNWYQKNWGGKGMTQINNKNINKQTRQQAKQKLVKTTNHKTKKQ